MNSELISERDDTQEAAIELRDSRPEAETIVLLWLAPQRLLNDADAYLFGEIRSAH